MKIKLLFILRNKANCPIAEEKENVKFYTFCKKLFYLYLKTKLLLRQFLFGFERVAGFTVIILCIILQLQVPCLESFDDHWQQRTKNRMLRNLNSRLSGVYQYLHLIFGSSSYQPSLPSDAIVRQAGQLFQVLRDRVDPSNADHADALLVFAHDILRNCSDLNALLEVSNGSGYNILQVAVIKNDTDLLDLLVLEGCDLNQGKCSLPLHLACHMGSRAMVDYLLNCGADLTLEKGMCYPLPHTPVRHVPSRFHFLETDIFACDSNHQLPLMYAIKQDHVDIVQRLLHGIKGPDTNWPYHRRPLHHAAESGAWHSMQYLLQIKPSEVNTLSDEGISPVLYAVKWGKKFVQHLVEAGADLCAVTTKKQTALHLLFRNIQDPLELFETTRFLLASGLEQDINTVDHRRNTALHDLLSLANRKITSFAIAHQPSEQVKFDGQVLSTLRLLLSNNSDPNVVNTSGVMTLHKLILLLDFVTSTDSSAITLETLPARETYKVDFSLLYHVLSVLLEHHVHVNCATSAGRTPLVLLLQSTLNIEPAHMVELRDGYVSCISLLCNHGAHPSCSLPTHIGVVCTLSKYGEKCLRQRARDVQEGMSEFVQEVLACLLQHGLDSNHCSRLAKQSTGNILTEMVKLSAHIRYPADLTYVYRWVLTALQWGANPDVEPYPSDSIIVHSQSSIFLKAKGTQPVHQYMYQIQDFNQIFDGGHAEQLLMLFYNSMDHKPLYQCLCSAKIMSRFDPDRTPTYSFIKMVSGLASQPRSLQQIARVAIYKALQRQLKPAVASLPLPFALKQYLVNIE